MIKEHTEPTPYVNGTYETGDKVIRIPFYNVFSLEIPKGHIFKTQTALTADDFLLASMINDDSANFDEIEDASYSFVVSDFEWLAIPIFNPMDSDETEFFRDLLDEKLYNFDDLVLNADMIIKCTAQTNSETNVVIGAAAFLSSGVFKIFFHFNGSNLSREACLDVAKETLLSIRAISCEEKMKASPISAGDAHARYNLTFKSDNRFHFDDLSLLIPDGFEVRTDLKKFNYMLTKNPPRPLLVAALTEDRLGLDDENLNKTMRESPLSINIVRFERDSSDSMQDFLTHKTQSQLISLAIENNFVKEASYKLLFAVDRSYLIFYQFAASPDLTGMIYRAVVVTESAMYQITMHVFFTIADYTINHRDHEVSILKLLSTLQIDGKEVVPYQARNKGQKKKGKAKAKFSKTKPSRNLYPHYFLNSEASRPSIPGVTVVRVTHGTQYQFIPIRQMKDDSEDEEMNALYTRIIQGDSEAYKLHHEAKKMQKLFRVNEAVFDSKRDREGEIEAGYMRSAYMMSALRSFAWTLADYCSRKRCEPTEIKRKAVLEIVDFIAARQWLNYDDKSHCQGLCSGRDLHVYYIPDDASEADRAQLLSDKDEILNTLRTNAPYSDPSTFDIYLSELQSLNGLRDDLAYIFPAVKTLWDSLEAERDYDQALTGNAADIVYAWCALALAARDPFFTEDGPMFCFFGRPTDEDKTETNISSTGGERTDEEFAEWMRHYEEHIEVDPDIDFSQTLFIFSGLNSKPEKEHPIVQQVCALGGQFRTTVSGLTNYLVVDPVYAGTSKMKAAIEQQKKGKRVKIILLADLLKALKDKTSDTQLETSSGPKPAQVQKVRKKPQAKPIKESSLAVEYTTLTLDDCEIDDNGTLIAYRGQAKAIVLPDGIRGIAKHAFNKNENITHIIIPEGVTTIDKIAFSHCSNLREVTLPSTQKQIGTGVFWGCKSLKQVTISEGCEEIGEEAFSFCEALSNINLPSTLKRISDYAFNDCISLKHVIIPDGCEDIEDAAFGGCEALSTIKLPDTLKRIGDYAFEGCKSLKGVIIPENCEDIGKATFASCEALSNIELPKALKRIGDHAFEGCESLQEVVIPDNCEEIGEEAFLVYPNKSLVIHIPASIHHIADNAFSNSNYLTIQTPSGSYADTFAKAQGLKVVHQAQPSCFSSSSLQGKDDHISKIEAGVEVKRTDYEYNSAIKFALPPGYILSRGKDDEGKEVVRIKADEYVDDLGETEYKFDCGVNYETYSPNELADMMSSEKLQEALAKEEKNTRIVQLSETPKIIVRNLGLSMSIFGVEIKNFIMIGIIQVDDRSAMSLHTTGRYNDSDPLQNSRLFDYMFELLKAVRINGEKLPLDSLTPSKLQDALELTFEEADESIDVSSKLPSNLPARSETTQNEYDAGRNKVVDEEEQQVKKTTKEPQAQSVNESASEVEYTTLTLDDCEIDDNDTLVDYRGQAKAIILPKGIRGIDEHAFSRNKNITHIIIPDGVTTIGHGAFSNCSDLCEATLPSTLKRISESAFVFCESLKQIIIPDSCEDIGESAFQFCDVLSNINLPHTLKRIGNYAFGDCISLKHVIIPDGCEDIGEGMFSGCEALSTIKLPSTLKRIGDFAFGGCKSLKQLIIPDGCEEIVEGMFSGCEALSTIKLPNTLKRIRDFAFEGCKSLKEVVIPDSCEEIGEEAFLIYPNESLTVIIPMSVHHIADNAFSNSNYLTIQTPSGSYAETFAKAQGLKVVNKTNSGLSSSICFCLL